MFCEPASAQTLYVPATAVLGMLFMDCEIPLCESGSFSRHSGMVSVWLRKGMDGGGALAGDDGCRR